MDIEMRVEKLIADWCDSLGSGKELESAILSLVREAVAEATRELEARLRDYEQRYGELGREGA